MKNPKKTVLAIILAIILITLFLPLEENKIRIIAIEIVCFFIAFFQFSLRERNVKDEYERKEQKILKNINIHRQKLEQIVNQKPSMLIEDLRKKHGVLFIFPKKDMTEKPIVDNVTEKFMYLWHKRIKIDSGFNGFNMCNNCGKIGSTDYIILPIDSTSDFFLTNSLACHYLVWHRDEIPESEMEKIREITAGIPEEEPKVIDLAPPVHL